MDAGESMPSPQLLEEYSQFFRLLSEPARLQLLCQLRQGPMDVAALIEASANAMACAPSGAPMVSWWPTSARWCNTASNNGCRISSSNCRAPERPDPASQAASRTGL